ncbi:hypothetical protein CDL15_Pgr026956 [Punica granatum]|uniref:Phosphatidylinositol 4-phosphate 5-kinase n=4 Tax=Punica granatum TaxID=22663 RepID=A0A218XYF4_PUNGR|nr:hypothetical protein CDL15_Pgr026956 [Punica granatum]
MSSKHGGFIKAWELTVRKSQAAAKKRANSIFATMSVAHVDDDDSYNAAPGEVYHSERVMPNGDFYTGQWADNSPHGHGKYLWTDGCMYVGEWCRGKPMGKGKFCWPSGATYEGEFKGGYMDGKGTYTGPSGDTYRGSWVMNLKHGQGMKSYVNGDYYEGDWRRGLQDGHGRYQWNNGNNYIGQWKNGMLNGNGTLIWVNGNRYDGFWEEGLPKGNGTYRWADGSFYVGVWSKDQREQSGTYYPSGSASGNLEWSPQEVYNVELLDCRICPGERISILPSQKILPWPGTEGQNMWKPPRDSDAGPGRPRRRSVDGRVSNYSWASDGEIIGGEYPRDEGFGSLRVEDYEARLVDARKLLRIRPSKRQGETISKGHRNYDLMLNLQLGIRHAVGRPAPPTKSFDLKASYFDPKEKVWTKFPPEGSKHTPPHPSFEFKWKDYCPVVFRTLRQLFKVDAADYMISICGNDALRELSSPGKSGSFFYLTNDDRYMIKTMRKAEVKVLIRMLPAYYNHVRNYEDTMVTKFFGLHCVKSTGPAQKKVRFVIMGNLFCSEYTFHRRFDLKGSSHGRVTDKPESEIEANTTLKDLDLNFIFRLEKKYFQDFCRQVDRDCDFLEQERIMDYSLLVGLHFRDISYNNDNKIGEARPFVTAIHTPRGGGNSDFDHAGPRLSSADMDKIVTDPSRSKPMRLGINVPAKAELTVRRCDGESQLVGEPTGEMYDVVVTFGIIDILQDYDISKKLEHAYKSIQYDPTSISAVDPKQYSRRFRDFIFRIFVEDT